MNDIEYGVSCPVTERAMRITIDKEKEESHKERMFFEKVLLFVIVFFSIIMLIFRSQV